MLARGRVVCYASRVEEDSRLPAAAALAVIGALVFAVIQYAGGRPAAGAAAGPGWYSRISPFGSAPSARPAPASEASELAAPERMMTNAVTRQFSNPTSAGSSGGLAGAEPSVPADSSASASMSAARLSGVGNVDLPGGSRAPTAGGASSFGPAPGPGPGPGRAAPSGSAAGAAQAAAPGAAAGANPRSGAGSTQSGAAPAAPSAAAFAGGAAFRPASAARGGAETFGGAGRAAPPSGEALNGAAALAPSASPGAEGGGPGGSPGGGAGGKAGGEMGGKVPDAKPKGEAAADAKAAAAGGSAGPSSAGGPSGAAGPTEEIAAPSAAIGEPRVGTVTVRGGMFRLRPNGPAEIPTTVHVTPRGARLVGFTAKLAIDADGASDAWKSDPTGQSKTSLLYKNGESLNPRALPFIVVPVDFHNTHPNVRLGDYATVTYGAKTLYAIVGDKGPAGVLGEGSIALAAGLGINPDPIKGGISRADVRYMIAPGSRDQPDPPRDAATVQARGKAIFEAAGAPVR